MSFKDEIKDDLKRFTDPLKQDIRNIKDDIADAIYVSEHKEEFKEEGKKGGCFPKVLLYGVLIYLACVILAKCDGNSGKIERSDSVSGTISQVYVEDQKNSSAKITTVYEALLATSRNSIEQLLASEPVDQNALYKEYRFLLLLRVSEYMFKSMGYGYFTDDYETSKFNYLVQEIESIRGEMSLYFSESRVESDFEEMSVLTFKSFDESNFYYDDLLIGTTNVPDVDAMWERYIILEIGIEE